MPEIKPIVVALWCGVGKPKDLEEFLLPLVNELNCLIKTGIFFNEYRVDIGNVCFICDSPARSHLKGYYTIYNKISTMNNNQFILMKLLLLKKFKVLRILMENMGAKNVRSLELISEM